MFFEEKGNAVLKVIITIIILVVLGIVGFFIFNKKDKVIPVSTKINYEYFPLYALDGKVGIVDKKGKEVIKPEYSNVFIPNPEVDIFECVTEEGVIFLDSKGNKLLTNIDSPSVIITSESTQDVERFVLSYKKDDKYGLIDLNGNKLTNAEYDEVKSLEGKPGYILLRKDNKYGLIDSNGNEILSVKYNAIKSDDYSSEESGYSNTGFIISERTDNGIIYGYADYSGNVIVAPKYESVARVQKKTKDVYLIVMDHGKKGVLKNSKQLIKNNFQSVRYHGIADIFIVEKTGKYGFYSSEGKEILKPSYKSYSVSKEYITVEEDDKIVMYDFFGNVVKTNNFASVQEVEGTSYFIAKNMDGYYSIISKDVNVNDNYKNITYAFGDYFIFTDESDKTGVLHVWEGVVLEPKYEYILRIEGKDALEARDEENTLFLYNNKIEPVFSMDNAVVQNIDDNYSVIYSGKEMKYIDKNGNFVENTVVYPNNTLFSVEKDGLWGFKDKSDNIVVPCKYDFVTEINEYGFAGVKQDDKWGVIDSSGKEIVVPAYEIESYYFPEFIGKYKLEDNETIVCIELEEK